MKKYLFYLMLVLIILAGLPGCTPAEKEITIDTDFERMLGYVPYEFLEDYGILFGNPGKAKEIYEIEDITGFEEFMSLLDEERRYPVEAILETYAAIPIWSYHPELFSLAGFDSLIFDRIINIGNAPPAFSCIVEGSFDEELITGKLTEQGYSRQEHGQHEYYAIRGDFDIGLESPLGRLAMASLNRVAVFDNTLITSPMTDVITGVFDAMDGNMPSIIDNPACLALADSLGEVLMGVISLPETIIYTTPDLGGMPYFDFDVPADWGQLQGYGMAALGYRAEKDDRYLDIALYYDDSETAESDGELIITRMQSYILGTWHVNFENMPFTDRYEPGEAVVKSYAEGAVLKISCLLIAEGRRGGVQPFIGSESMPFRDLLFLAPDPSPYIGKNEETKIIIHEEP
jgi:hypothetical protein